MNLASSYTTKEEVANINFLQQRQRLEAGEMAWSIKGFPHRHKDSSLLPSTQIRKLSAEVTHTHNARTEALWRPAV